MNKPRCYSAFSAWDKKRRFVFWFLKKYFVFWQEQKEQFHRTPPKWSGLFFFFLSWSRTCEFNKKICIFFVLDMRIRTKKNFFLVLTQKKHFFLHDELQTKEYFKQQQAILIKKEKIAKWEFLSCGCCETSLDVDQEKENAELDKGSHLPLRRPHRPEQEAAEIDSRWKHFTQWFLTFWVVFFFCFFWCD